LLRQLFRRSDPRETMTPLYATIVAEARVPGWYLEGVPDTTDGRFDMVASVLSLVLLRLERDDTDTRQAQALLAETFVDDMDGALRQMGIGDLMVGKHVGRMMGALGGRLSAFKAALAGQGDLAAAIRRNIFRDEATPDAAVIAVEARLRALAGRIDAAALPDVLAGRIA